MAVSIAYEGFEECRRARLEAQTQRGRVDAAGVARPINRAFDRCFWGAGSGSAGFLEGGEIRDKMQKSAPTGQGQGARGVGKLSG